jgi:hypothetical protein
MNTTQDADTVPLPAPAPTRRTPIVLYGARGEVVGSLAHLEPCDANYIRICADLAKAGLSVITILGLSHPMREFSFKTKGTQDAVNGVHEIIPAYHAPRPGLSFAACALGLDHRLSLPGRLGKGIYITTDPLKAAHHAGGGILHSVQQMFEVEALVGKPFSLPPDTMAPDFVKEPYGFQSVYGVFDGSPEYALYDNDRVQIRFLILYATDFRGHALCGKQAASQVTESPSRRPFSAHGPYPLPSLAPPLCLPLGGARTGEPLRSAPVFTTFQRPPEARVHGKHTPPPSPKISPVHTRAPRKGAAYRVKAKTNRAVCAVEATKSA